MRRHFSGIGTMETAISRVDRWRGPTFEAAGGPAVHKEWMHFCIGLPGSRRGHLLVNVSMSCSLEGGREHNVARLMVLVERGRWCGSIEEQDERERASPSTRGLDAAIGGSRITFRSCCFHLSLRTESVTAEITLAPEVLPTVPTMLSLGHGRSLHWVAVPRLTATGWVQLDERIELVETLAYHDHNWGVFEWGKDLRWEWAFVHPDVSETPWSAVIARVSDGTGERTWARTALVWCGPNLVRTFQHRELTFELSGHAVARSPFTLPRVAQLLFPELSVDVPQLCQVRARGSADALDISFETQSRSRIAIPSETEPLGMMVLNEVSAQARVRGVIDQRAFEFTGPAIMEFARA